MTRTTESKVVKLFDALKDACKDKRADAKPEVKEDGKAKRTDRRG